MDRGPLDLHVDSKTTLGCKGQILAICYESGSVGMRPFFFKAALSTLIGKENMTKWVSILDMTSQTCQNEVGRQMISY